MANRTGLYMMVFLAMIAGFVSCDNSKKILRNLNSEKESKKLELKVENVIGKETPEKFYEINGERVYLEIDGRPVEEYFQSEYK